MRGPALSVAEQNRAVAMLRAGWAHGAVAKALRRSQPAISRLAKREGIEPLRRTWKGPAWTETENRSFAKLWLDGASISSLMLAFDRSRGGVHARRHYLLLPNRRPAPWSQSEVNQALEMSWNRVPRKQIAEALNRPYNSVRRVLASWPDENGIIRGPRSGKTKAAAGHRPAVCGTGDCPSLVADANPGAAAGHESDGKSLSVDTRNRP